MVQTRYAPDRGLQARMGLTMFVLGLVFVALVVALVFILQAFGVGSGAIIFFAVLLGGGMAFGSLFWSDKIALRASGAREVTPQEGPQLQRQRWAALSGGGGRRRGRLRGELPADPAALPVP